MGDPSHVEVPVQVQSLGRVPGSAGRMDYNCLGEIVVYDAEEPPI